MSGERRLRILSMLVADGRDLEAKKLCEVCAEATNVTGAGIMLMTDDVAHGAVCSSNATSALVERLQYDLGEGPCLDAYRHDWPILEPDLKNPDTPRWFGFTPPAVAAGVKAIFGFPLQVGAVRLGALNLYRDQPGPLSDSQHADALVMADVAAQAVLVLQSGAAPGQLAVELEASADFQYVVHQATGMVAAQLEVSVTQALIRLRAYAFGNDRPLTEVARDVVARELRFDEHSGEKDPVA